MKCNCKSQPQYHRDDCPNYYPNGSMKEHYEMEVRFNKDLENQIGKKIPFYFKFHTHSSFYRAKPYNKNTKQITTIDKIDDSIKHHLKILCEKFFNSTGNLVTYD